MIFLQMSFVMSRNSGKNSPGTTEYRWIRSGRSWARRHVYSLLSSLGSLYRNRLGTLLTVVVLGVALALPLGLYVALKNLDGVNPVSEQLGAIAVYLKQDIPRAEVDALRLRLEALDPVKSARVITPQQALDEFAQQSGLSLAVQALDKNPLPYVLNLVLDIPTTPDRASQVEALTSQLEQNPEVAFAQYDLDWLYRLQAMLSLAGSLVQVLSLVFGLAVIVVVGNTIRLDIQNKHEEIEVMSLVGATDSFIRRPFLYTGFWYGLLGG